MKAWFYLFLLLGISFNPLPIYAKTTSSKTKKAKKIPKVIVKSTKLHSDVPTDSQVVLLSQQSIQHQGAVRIKQVLQGLPGVQVQDLNGDGNKLAISMRGFGSNAAQNSLIVFNGVPLDNPDISVPSINAIALPFISHIGVINASEGVLYGNQAVGGVVNIVSTAPTHFVSQGDISHGSFDQWLYRAYMADALPHGLSYRFFVQKNRSDNYREHNNIDDKLINGQLGLHYTTGSVRLFYYVEQQYLQFPGALSLQQLLQNRRQAQNLQNFSDADFDNIQVQQRQQLWHHWLAITNFAYRHNQYNGELFGFFSQGQNTYYLSPHVQGLIGDGLLTVGLVWQQAHYGLASSLGTTKDQQTQQAVYGQYNLPFNYHWSAIVGLRLAQQENQLATNKLSQNSTNQAHATTVGLAYKINKHWNVHIRRAGSFRFPKADENAITENHQTLKTQTGISYELGIDYSRLNYSLHANAFILNLDHEIAFDPTKTLTQPFGANRNLAPTRRLGILLWGIVHITRTISLNAQYSHIDPRFRSGIHKGKVIPFVPQNSYQLAVFYHPNPYWIYFLQGIYTGSMYASGDINNKKSRQSGYFLLNFNVRFKKQHIYTNFRLNNILNVKYNSFTSFSPSSHQLFFYPAPGRNFLITVGYYFA